MRQSGFSVIEGILIVAVIAVFGGVGYLAYSNFVAPKDTDTTAAVSTSPSPSPSASSAIVTSSKDLDTVSSQLDSVTVDDSDSSSLDSAASSF